MNCNNYKDATPSQTIERINEIADHIGINIQDTQWINNKDNFFSCRVNIGETRIGTNGKGISREYSLASAMAELIERLSNQIIFSHIPMRKEFANEFDFVVDPHEVYYDISDLKALPLEFTKAILADGEDPDLYWESYFQTIYNKTKQKPIGVPFYELYEDRTIYLPHEILLATYGSNGMVAGNSQTEAIVQGLSEVIERYIMKKILLKNITPPTISKQYLKKNLPIACSLIEVMEKSGEYSVTVKDGSLGVGFPAIITIIVNHKMNGYFVKVGVDPDTEIALQRCLTETLQGREMDNFVGLSPVDFGAKLEDRDLYETYHSVLTTGIGQHPTSLFLERDQDWDFQGVSKMTNTNQQDRASFLINLIHDLGFKIYLRDVSFMGFPAMFIIVPGMSETYLNSSDHNLNFLAGTDREKYISCLSNASESHLKELLERLNNSSLQNIAMSEYLGIPMKPGAGLYRMTVGFIRSTIQYRLGNINEAYEEMRSFVEFVEKYNGTINLNYHYCLRDYLWLRMELGNDDMSICKSLSCFYKKEIIDEIIDDLRYPEDVFNNLELPNNWNCSECKLKSHCQYDEIESIQRSIKKAAETQQLRQEQALHEVVSQFDLRRE